MSKTLTFKNGDIVKCVSQLIDVKMGHTYTITHSEYDSDVEREFVKVDNKDTFYYAERFELAEVEIAKRIIKSYE